jgi:hypothetical protein
MGYISDNLLTEGNAANRERAVNAMTPGAGVAYNAGRALSTVPSAIADTIAKVPSAIEDVAPYVAPFNPLLAGGVAMTKASINAVRGFNNVGPLGSPPGPITAAAMQDPNDPYATNKTLRVGNTPPLAVPMAPPPVAENATMSADGLMKQAQQRDLRARAYAPTQYSQPAPPPPVDPIAVAKSMRGNHTLSGIINAGHYLRQYNADAANKVASENADTNRLNANTQDKIGTANAETSRFNANTNAFEATTRAGTADVNNERTRGDIEKGALDLQERKAKQALNAELADPKTTALRRKQIEQILVAQHGKNPAVPQIHATPIFDENGQKVGENLYERQADGTWKDVMPQPQKSPYPEGTQLKGKDGKTYVVKNGQPVPK